MIVAGFGFREGVAASSLRVALALVQDGHAPVMLLATAQDKVAGLRPLAQTLGVPVVGVAAETLGAMATITRSPASLAARGTGSVAEASALAAAGAGGRLLGPRRITPDRMATCALAQGLPT